MVDLFFVLIHSANTSNIYIFIFCRSHTSMQHIFCLLSFEKSGHLIRSQLHSGEGCGQAERAATAGAGVSRAGATKACKRIICLAHPHLHPHTQVTRVRRLSPTKGIIRRAGIHGKKTRAKSWHHYRHHPPHTTRTCVGDGEPRVAEHVSSSRSGGTATTHEYDTL